jgi:hypothetical protein
MSEPSPVQPVQPVQPDTAPQKDGEKGPPVSTVPLYDHGKLGRWQANLLGAGLIVFFLLLLGLFVRLWSLDGAWPRWHGRHGGPDANSAARAAGGNAADGRAAGPTSATTAPAAAGDAVASDKVIGTDGPRMLMLIMVSGALGAWFYAASKYFLIRATAGLDRSWVWWYFLTPPIGSVLAVTFYLLLVGGLLTAGSGNVSKPGAVAMSLLVGMFTRKATEKLNEVFSTLFSTKSDSPAGASGTGSSGSASGSSTHGKKDD